MISILFNALCIGTFATFGLTCTLIQTLCCKRCGRNYPAIENGPCICKKHIPSIETASICTSTSNTFLENTNQRRKRSSNFLSDVSQCTSLPIPNCPNLKCMSDTSVDSQNTSCIPKNSNFENDCYQDDNSCNLNNQGNNFSPVSSTFSCNSDIFNKLTICSKKSYLPNNTITSINSFSNKCLASCKVGQNKTLDIPATSKRSCKNTSSEKGLQCCYCKNKKQNSTEDCQFQRRLSYDYNKDAYEDVSICSSENNSALESISCYSNIHYECDNISSTDEVIRDKIHACSRLENSNTDICCILKPRSNISLDESASKCNFLNDSNNKMNSLISPVYCKWDRKLNSEENKISDCCIITCKAKTEISNSSDLGNLCIIDVHSDTSDNISRYLAVGLHNSFSKYQHKEGMNSSKTNSFQSHNNFENASDNYAEQCGPNSICSEIVNKFKSLKYENSKSNSEISNEIKSLSNINECQKDCSADCNSTQVSTPGNKNNSKISNKIKTSQISLKNTCNECEMNCCTKCSYTKTTISESCPMNPEIKPKLRSNERQTDCCTNCICVQTIFPKSYDIMSQTTNDFKPKLCSIECQTDCYTKCKCAQTTISKFVKRNSQAKDTNECQKNIKTEAMDFYKSQTTNTITPSLCNNQCQTNCNTKCYCTQTIASKIYKKISDTTSTVMNECVDECCKKYNCTCTITPKSLKINSRKTNKNKLTLCNTGCQTEFCAKCTCAQTESLKNCKAKSQAKNKKSKLSCNACQTECCTKCIGTQTINTILCNNECQTKFYTKCKCAQTIITKNCKMNSISCSKEYQEDCCTTCKCAQTSESTFCSEAYQTDCNCAQTSQRTSSKECQMDCYSICNCAQTKNIESKLCSNACQTDCCTKCNSTQTTSDNHKKSQTSNRKKLKLCCTKCCAAQTEDSNNYKKDSDKCPQIITENYKTNLNENCANVCCSKCERNDKCTKKTSETQVDAASNYADSFTQCKCLKICPKKSEFSINESKSSTTMMIKRRRVSRKCCSHPTRTNNDTVLIQGDIQIKQIPNGPLKYVFKTEESDNAIRVHELSLNIKQCGCSQINQKLETEDILGKYLLKLKVHT